MALKCACCTRRRSTDSSYNSISLDPSESESKKRKWPLWKMILVWSLVALFGLVLLAFILIWVVVPIVFWLSIAFQRLMIFMPIQAPKNPTFDEPEAYGIKGVHNFYITTRDYYNNNTFASIGAWLILPEDEVNSTTSTNVTEIIKNTKHDILLYLHGVAENRAKPITQYEVFRKHYLVISIDHRGYGDSGKNVQMSEAAIVHDHLQIYDWVREINSKNDLYYWGHSLGTGLSCHTVRALKEQKKVVPKGLILESPFTNIADEVKVSLFGKMYKWLAYFNATVLKPLDDNGFQFYSTKNILFVDCPIMIFHAEDDNVIPCTLGKQLAHIASTERLSSQGNVTLHIFDAVGYGHNDCTNDPGMPHFISEFKAICQDFSPSTT